MRRPLLIGALLMAVVWSPFAIAQAETYGPALGDLMIGIQFRHIKLWFAGKQKNWELASYELRQIKASLEYAAELYTGIPVNYVTATAQPIKVIEKAIEMKNAAQFAKGVNILTATCNACHQGTERGFIVIRVPKGSPFTNQSFAPPKKQN